MTRARAALLALALAACALPPQGAGPRSDGLMRQMQSCLADPGQGGACTIVAPGRGFVVVKDDSPEKPLAWLIVPSNPEVTGMEDPAIFTAPVAGFWREGWQAGRRLVPVPPADLALAINSEAGRTQNLLHIHISCVDPKVRAAIAAAAIGRGWAPGPTLAGQDWQARRVDSLDPSPFLLLRELPGAAEAPGLWSLAALAAPGGGYVLLAGSSRPGAPATAESLLDETCGDRHGGQPRAHAA
ncbi:CDP-diacylglycerol diphosphatase [Amaricoccus sp.]|uniref:CDP-diacylglycerol diphosphatase n=1 Tax=Amaricoccus sp. TaxID=1872485 RepID=UPI001B574399|nr:CDP-diacylglycerol diphosphatase [Amaricoccus sp.]MBP7002968.1 CDP-diacylglycerol diphosphatase [Amaricoccus sp.]